MTHAAQILNQAEDIEALQQYRFAFDAIHMWPIVRHKVLWACCKRIENLVFERDPKLAAQTQNIRQQHLSSLSKDDILERIAELKSSQVLVISTPRQTANFDGRTINKYLWPFEQLTECATLNEAFSLEELRTDHAHQLWHEYVFQYARIQCRESASEADQLAIAGLISCIKRLFGQWLDDSIYAQVSNLLMVCASRLAYWKQAYARIFDNVQPRVMVLGNASYGHRGFLVDWAKAAGIRVAEFQHAAIHKNLTPYQYPPHTAGSEYARRYLPDDFLAFGAYWQSIFNSPSQFLPIGNPYFQLSKQSFSTNGQDILVCLNGFDMAYAIDYLMRLHSVASGRVIRVRLHPVVQQLQAELANQLPADMQFSAAGSSLFDDFATAGWVISEASTVIYEALALGLPTFLMPTREWPRLPGLLDADNALQVDVFRQPPGITGSDDAYFGDNWRAMLRKYLTQQGVSCYESA